MSFARRHPRITYRCAAMLTLPGGETVLGELVDLSVGGAGMMLQVSPTKLPRGTRVAVLIEAEDLPDPGGEGTVISVRAVVAQVALLGKGTGGTGQARYGLEFSAIPHGLAARIAARQAGGPLADGTGSNEAVGPPGPALAKTPHGREILFQHARACIASKNFTGAMQAMNWALENTPGHVEYGVLRLRAVAEQALSLGDRAAARVAADAALALAPGSSELASLVGRLADSVGLPQPARKGLLGRLFAR
jgi:hypothetical protein